MRAVVLKFDEQRPQQDNVVLALLQGGMWLVTGLTARLNADNVRLALLSGEMFHADCEPRIR